MAAALAAVSVGSSCLAAGVSPPVASPIGAATAFPLWTGIPFLGILLSIALFPVLAPELWRRHYPRVAAFWAGCTVLALFALIPASAAHLVAHIFLTDYLPFIILLWGLFTISGGIVIRGRLSGTPRFNALFLLVGSFAASLIGTTGAAMLLIRPLLRANRRRRHKAHTVVFFIFLTANIGGSLSPLGDPPLFLGFLHGVPFLWTLRLFPIFAAATAILLVVYFCVESWLFRHETPGVIHGEEDEPRRLTIQGRRNFLLLGGVIGVVLISGAWPGPAWTVLGLHFALPDLLRDLAIVALGVASLRITRVSVREYNGFCWDPIREVAVLFAGIFVAMIPVIDMLKAGSAGPLAALVNQVERPWQYFWAVGSLSSFLDNAPTYYTFFNLALGGFFPGVAEPEAVKGLIASHGAWLQAISAGAVFMGANTYIGNAPNFMVRSIAEASGVPMPSFFGYVFRWSLPILIPTFALVGWIFFGFGAS